MKNKWLDHKVFVIIIFLMALLTLVACAKVEQVEDPNFPATDFTSATDHFSLKVPTGWSTQEAVPGAIFIMANSETALENYRNGNANESGELVLNIGFLPIAFLKEKELSHLGIQLEASPEVFLQSLLPMFLLGDKPAGNIVGEATLVSLSDRRDAGRLTFSEEGREGLILVFPAGKNVFAFLSAATYPGGLQDFQEIIFAVAAGVAYSGSQNALYSALYGD